MELHDDAPDYFEFVLKFIYTEEYDKEAIKKMAGDDKIRRVLVPIEAYAVADKYDVVRLFSHAAEDVRAVLLESSENDYKVLKAAIQSHYRSSIRADGAMGKAIASVVLDHKRNFTKTDQFELAMTDFPLFATDLALGYHRQGMFKIRISTCSKCTKVNAIMASGFNISSAQHQYCAGCGTRQTM